MTTALESKPASVLIRFRETRIAASAGSVDCGDWEVGAGEAWFVAGGVGAGKTSLVRSIAGLEQPLAGRIERFGEDWANFSEGETLQQRRRIGVVLCREAGLFHRLTVRENIRLPLRYHGGRSQSEIDERVNGLLAALDLESHAQVSSMRVGPAVARRTLLARSLALGPEVLLLDDPCAGLDEWDRRRLMQFITRLHAGHELNEGRPMALIMTGVAPRDWREFPALKWASLRGGALSADQTWEQLVASAPELFHDPDTEAAAD